jgi:3-hydroxyacyl-CoA dehydrogenase
MKVAVIGAGTMGSGIAQTFAQAESVEKVYLCDIKTEFAEGGFAKIKKGLDKQVAKGKKTQEEADKITGKIQTGLNDICADADLVVEAALEVMDIKKNLFKELQDNVVKNPDCIFASNTSSLSITEIGSGLSKPIIGMHFFNPAPVMKLVEVIQGANTPADMVEKIKKISEDLGKTPVQVSLFSFCSGYHLYFLTRLPSPAIIAEAFKEICPDVVIAVPLIIEKIIRKRVFPKIQNNAMKLMLQMPVVKDKVKQRICKEVYDAFGGKAYEVIAGGAPLNQEVEKFLKDIGFPITVGYGTTECAPLISYSDHFHFIPSSCGQPVNHMEVKILSSDPQHIEGEIVCRGTHVMLGYYKNEEATRQAIDKDGWYHTGDLATMSADGHIFIRGRLKNMLLGANGQNVYPEEIEDKLNSMAMVSESLIVQRGDKLVALIHPDVDEAKSMGFSDDDIANIMEQNRQELNAELPVYSKIQQVELFEEEFQKTPKKSIKRYLYK